MTDDSPVSMPIRKQQIGGTHYNSMSIQPWDAMEEWMSVDEFRGFLLGNVIKYVARHAKKNGKEDLLKAKHYLDKVLELEDKNVNRSS